MTLHGPPAQPNKELTEIMARRPLGRTNWLRGTAVAALAAGLLWSVPAGQAATISQLRTLDNHRVSNEPDPLRGKSAPGLAVDPGNPRHVVEVQHDLINFECQTNVSNDGGTTWAGPQNLRGPAAFGQQGPCSVLGHGADAMDQSVAFGTGQNVYVPWATASTAGIGNESVLVNRSTDGGASFPASASIVALKEGTELSPNPMPGGTGINAGPGYAFPKLAVVPGGGRHGADRIIVASVAQQLDLFTHQQFGNLFVAISDDSGATWTDPIRVSRPVDRDKLLPNGRPNPNYNPFFAQEASQIVVGPDGAYYITWRTSPTVPSTDPTYQDGFIRMDKSTDGGIHWAESNVIDVHAYVYTGPKVNPYFFGPPNPNVTITTRFRGSSFPRLAVDHHSGNLYLTFAQHTGWYNKSGLSAQDHFEIQNSASWFMTSTNGAASWSEPKQVNRSPLPGVPSEDFPDNSGINTQAHPGFGADPIEHHRFDTQTRHPNVSVAPDGRVDVTWLDRRHSYEGCSQTHQPCSEARFGDVYYSYSIDGGAHFSPNRRITDRTMDADVGFDYRFSTYWDYGPVAAALGDSGKVLFAWMDSRQGNFDNDTQDVYVGKLDLSATGPVPVRSIGTDRAPVLSVDLSRAATPGGSEAVLAGTFASREATKVVIANERDVAGALAGGVLARANLGPLLLSPASGLTAVVKHEVSRMSPIGAYVIGNTDQLSDKVVADLASAGVPAGAIERISGPSKAAVAAQIALAMDRRSPTDKAAGLPAFDAVAISRDGSPESTAVSDLAAARRIPVLYVNGSVPQATTDALHSLNINKALVIGGPGVVGGSVFHQLEMDGLNPTRLGGPDQYATSRAVLEESIARGLPTNQVFVGDGDKPMHPALLGYSSARIGGLLLLTPGGSKAEAESQLAAMGLKPKLDRLLTSTLLP